MDQFNDITTTTEVITPEIAKAYLEKSKGNPRWSTNKLYDDRTVAKYANAMLNGAWEFNGETISFDTEGHLRNGHHRLAAVIRAGVPVKMRVNRNVPFDVKTYDEGATRPRTQILRNEWGVETRGQLNAALTLWVQMTEGSAVARALITRDFKDMLDDDLWHIADKLCYRSVNNKRPFYQGGAICAIYAALKCGEDPERLRQFVDVVLTGFYSSPGDTSAVMAAKFLREPLPKSAGGFTRGPYICTYLQACIRDFCKYTERKKKYTNPEAFYTDRFAKLYAREAERIR